MQYLNINSRKINTKSTMNATFPDFSLKRNILYIQYVKARDTSKGPIYENRYDYTQRDKYRKNFFPRDPLLGTRRTRNI